MAKRGAFALGAALFVALLGSWGIERGVAGGADVALSAARHAELDVQFSPGPLARKTLTPSAPGGGVGGRLSVRNATGARLLLTLRATAETRSLDGALRLRVRSSRRVLFTGTLAALRRGAAIGPLASHATLDLSADAWITAATEGGFQSRKEHIVLSFVTRSAGDRA